MEKIADLLLVQPQTRLKGGLIYQQCQPKNHARDYEAEANTPEEAKGHSFILKDEETFAVFGRGLDVHLNECSEQGVYRRGCRHLSGWMLFMMGKPPVHLKTFHSPSATELVSYLGTNELTQNGEYLPPGAVSALRRYSVKGNRAKETLRVVNYHHTKVETEIKWLFQADFKDMFQIRGIERRNEGRFLGLHKRNGGIEARYEGLDGVRRSTVVDWSRSPSILDDEGGSFVFELAQSEAWEIEITFHFLEGEEVVDPCGDYEKCLLEADSKRENYYSQVCSVVSNNDLFNRWLLHSGDDLRILSTSSEFGDYPMAGLPWFGALFGRDSIITSLMSLWHRPDLAKGVLRNLAAFQGKGFDPNSEEEPGRILHEFRKGEMAQLKEIPFGLYYGAVDTTPLYIVLAHAYVKHAGDIKFLEEIWDTLMDCATWIQERGDKDNDGFIEYPRNEKGLLDQGWKDSPGAITHKDGSLAPGPIALCEAQAYVVGAYRGLSELSEMAGKFDLRDRFKQLEIKTKAALNEAFWWKEENFLYVGLDGKKRPCEVVASNPGHCLWMEALYDERARLCSNRLMKPDLFSGWGIRTVSENEGLYHPVSYHNGSVWPHDTALAAAGLCRYGSKKAAAKIFDGIFKAALSFEFDRLPELICGFTRESNSGPIPFPSACSPQAWTSAIAFLALSSLLGLEVDGAKGKLTLKRPYMPLGLRELNFTNLRVGDSKVSFTLYKKGKNVALSVDEIKGQVEIIMLPEEL